MKYLTTVQFRLQDTGVLTAEITDLMLAQYIQNAETDIDAWMGFTLQTGGFEIHRAWTQSAWDQDTLRTRVPNFPVPIQQVFGYKIQVSNLSGAGAGFFATLNSGDVAINVYEGYVEVVPLQAVTYALSPVLMQLGLNPPLVQMEYQAGFYFPVFGEMLLNSGDNLTYYMQRGFITSTYTEALHLQPLLLPPVPPVVYLNGIAQAATIYTLSTTDGSVTFSLPNKEVDIVKADYTYTIPDAVKQAAIARTTYLLGQRQLNKLGMSGLDQIQGGEQRARRVLHPQFKDMMDPYTAEKLAPYMQIASA